MSNGFKAILYIAIMLGLAALAFWAVGCQSKPTPVERSGAETITRLDNVVSVPRYNIAEVKRLLPQYVFPEAPSFAHQISNGRDSAIAITYCLRSRIPSDDIVIVSLLPYAKEWTVLQLREDGVEFIPVGSAVVRNGELVMDDHSVTVDKFNYYACVAKLCGSCFGWCWDRAQGDLVEYFTCLATCCAIGVGYCELLERYARMFC